MSIDLKQPELTPIEAQTEPVLSEPAPVDATTRQIQFLQRAVTVGFAGIILVNVGLTVLLVWQTKMVRAQLGTQRVGVVNYQRIQEPVINGFLAKLEAFGLQNTDYQGVLRKYPLLCPRFASMPIQSPGAVSIPFPAAKTPAGPASSSAAPASQPPRSK